MDLQSLKRIALWRRVGTPNCHGPLRNVCYATGDRPPPAHSRTVSDSYGRGNGNYQQPPYCYHTFRHQRATTPNPCYATHNEDASPYALTRSLCSPDLYARNLWRRAQYLADQFRVSWRREYLENLHRRTKWENRERNLSIVEIVLFKDESAHQNY